MKEKFNVMNEELKSLLIVEEKKKGEKKEHNWIRNESGEINNNFLESYFLEEYAPQENNEEDLYDEDHYEEDIHNGAFCLDCGIHLCQHCNGFNKNTQEFEKVVGEWVLECKNDHEIDFTYGYGSELLGYKLEGLGYKVEESYTWVQKSPNEMMYIHNREIWGREIWKNGEKVSSAKSVHPGIALLIATYEALVVNKKIGVNEK